MAQSYVQLLHVKAGTIISADPERGASGVVEVD